MALLVVAGWIYPGMDRMRSAQLRTQGLSYLLGRLDAMHLTTSEGAVRDQPARDGSKAALR
ncbi:hypothetical protein [Streptomyces scopuliridis]|uniref:hypothetical protein n=1 Tax=Streptomyces scopuliridis TaxID=452529 RepID=UPI000A9F64B0|nr:hypothetical protein [Streptomyces scopuliridis]